MRHEPELIDTSEYNFCLKCGARLKRVRHMTTTVYDRRANQAKSYYCWECPHWEDKERDPHDSFPLDED